MSDDISSRVKHPNSSLCSLYHCSQAWIIIHYAKRSGVNTKFTIYTEQKSMSDISRYYNSVYRNALLVYRCTHLSDALLLQ